MQGPMIQFGDTIKKHTLRGLKIFEPQVKGFRIKRRCRRDRTVGDCEPILELSFEAQIIDPFDMQSSRQIALSTFVTAICLQNQHCLIFVLKMTMICFSYYLKKNVIFSIQLVKDGGYSGSLAPMKTWLGTRRSGWSRTALECPGEAMLLHPLRVIGLPQCDCPLSTMVSHDLGARTIVLVETRF